MEQSPGSNSCDQCEGGFGTVFKREEPLDDRPPNGFRSATTPNCVTSAIRLAVNVSLRSQFPDYIFDSQALNWLGNHLGRGGSTGVGRLLG